MNEPRRKAGSSQLIYWRMTHETHTNMHTHEHTHIQAEAAQDKGKEINAHLET